MFPGWEVVGGLIVTYAVSRLLLHALRGRVSGMALLLAVHLGSWLLIALALGLIRSNFYEPFLLSAGLHYVLPQIFWLCVDRLRAPALKT